MDNGGSSGAGRFEIERNTDGYSEVYKCGSIEDLEKAEI